jgi:F0F1-type ATP synthase assembly protein I
MTETSLPNSQDPEPDPQARVMKILGAVCVAGIVAAIVIGALVKGAAGETTALLVGGISSVVGVCLAFYAVGRSEDRERAQRASDS